MPHARGQLPSAAEQHTVRRQAAPSSRARSTAHKLTQLNSAKIDVDGIGVFNPLWGNYSRARTTQGATNRDKPTAFIGGHVGGFFASTVDGVPHVVNGNSGKAPAEAGGFTGWTLVGVTENGIRAEIRPHVDALQVRAPGGLRAGTRETVAATLKQGSRTLPVKYPMAVVWEGSPGLHVGDAAGVRPWHVAWLDPGSGVLTAIRPGQVKISATVNGVTSGAEVRVGPRKAS